METLNIYLQNAIDLTFAYVPKVILAIVVLVAGLWLIKKLSYFLGHTMDSKKMDPSLSKFTQSLVSIALKVLLVISVASMIGIATTSFIAVLGAAGLAIGLALQGSLANFAGGALILVFKPFKIGDFIETQGHMGSVQEIQVFNTVLLTPDKKKIIVPNGAVAGGAITNFNAESERRVDWVFGVGYSDDVQKVKKVLSQLVTSDSKVLKDPAPQVLMSELADSSVNFTVRAWVKPADYWDVHFSMIERTKMEFDKQGISIPFPQRDVHVFQASGGTTLTSSSVEAGTKN